MTKLACRYAIVQFLPYPETGEFANVGVVVVCPAAGYFGFKLETRRSARCTHFFRDLDRTVYLRSVAALKEELARLQKVLRATGENTLREAFTLLIHPREAILRFGQSRALLADDPQAAVETLFARYVEHDFATRTYRETVLEERVQTLLRRVRLGDVFRPERIGDDEFDVRFPLVQMINDRPAKAIKPFFLAQDETNAIFEHGDRWLARLRRLKQRRLLPARVLFAVEGPDEADGKRFGAFQDVTGELREFADVIPISERRQVVEFARSPVASRR